MKFLPNYVKKIIAENFIKYFEIKISTLSTDLSPKTKLPSLSVGRVCSGFICKNEYKITLNVLENKQLKDVSISLLYKETGDS